MSNDDRPALQVSDYVIDCEDEAASDVETSVMLVVELTLRRADAVYIDDGTTVADVNDDRYVTDDVIRVIYPVPVRRTSTTTNRTASRAGGSSARRRFTKRSREHGSVEILSY